MPLALGSVLRTPVLGRPTLGAPALLLGNVARVAHVNGPRFPASSFAGSEITAELLDAADPWNAGPTALDDTHSRSWVEQLSDAGSANLTIQKDDTNFSDVAEGSLIRMKYRGNDAVVMVCETQDTTLLDRADESAERAAWTGRLHGSLLDRAVVDPSRGVRQNPVQESRTYDYTEPAYDASPWGPQQVLGSVETARYLMWYLSDFIKLFADTPDDIAREFPDPFAALMWAPGGTLLRGRPVGTDSGGDCYSRDVVWIDHDGDYDIWGICDDTMELSIDGVSVLSIGAANFASTGSARVTMSRGFRVIAIHGNNRKDAEVAWALNPGGVFNPGFFGWSIFRAGIIGLDGFVAHSTGNGKLAAYTSRVPGMTVGRAIRLERDEARARGVPMPELGFTDAVDSAGDPWTPGAPSTRVGTSFLAFLKELSVTQIDWKMRVGTFTLDVWNSGRLGATRSVPFDTGNLARLEKKGGEPISNSALTRTAYGWDRFDDTASIASYGRREFEYALGASNSPTDAAVTAAGRMNIIGQPRYQWDAEHRPVDLTDSAYDGYGVGDRVPLTPPDESPADQRVVSIAVSEDNADGNTTVTTTLNDVVLYASPIENFVAMAHQAIRKMIPGTGGGNWPETQPATPPSIATPVTAWQPPPQPPSSWSILGTPWYDPNCDGGSPPTTNVRANINPTLFGAVVPDGQDWWGMGIGYPGPPGSPSEFTNTTRMCKLDLETGFFTAYGSVFDAAGFDPNWQFGGNRGLPFGVHGGELVMFGVSNFPFVPSIVAPYDIATDTWGSLRTPMPGATDSNYAGSWVQIGSLMYLFGGEQTDNADAGGDTLNSWVYDMDADTWTSLAPLPTYGFWGAGTALVGGKVYCIGGQRDAIDAPLTYSSQISVYDIAGDSWDTSRTPPPLPPGITNNLTYCIAKELPDGSILYGGGYPWNGSGMNGTMPSANNVLFWIYDPDADTYTPTTSSDTTGVNPCDGFSTLINVGDPRYVLRYGNDVVAFTSGWEATGVFSL